MAALPYMQLYVADYMADTAHLSTLEHGAYLLLIMTYWQRGKPLSASPAHLARIARVTEDEWALIGPALSEFFTEADGVWSHKRLDRDLAAVQAKSTKARESRSQRGGDGRATNVQRSLDERATFVERTFHHKEADTDTDTEACSLRSHAARAHDADPDGLADLSRAVVAAFAEASPLAVVPDTARCRVWLERGYRPALIVEAIKAGLARKPGIRSLSYFDGAIADLHAPQVEPRSRGSPPKAVEGTAARMLREMKAVRVDP